MGNYHPKGCPEGVIPKGHVLWEMFLDLVYKHNQSIERTIIHKHVIRHFCSPTERREGKKKGRRASPYTGTHRGEALTDAGDEWPNWRPRNSTAALGGGGATTAAAARHRRPPACGARGALRQTAVLGRGRDKGQEARRTAAAGAGGPGGAWTARRRRPRQMPATAAAAAHGPSGGGASHRSTGAAAALGNGAAAPRAAQGRRPQRAVADPHPHGGGGSSRDQGRRPFEANPERPAPLLFYRPVTMDGLVWALQAENTEGQPINLASFLKNIQLAPKFIHIYIF